MKLAQVQSLAQLKSKVKRDDNYKNLVEVAAIKMGFPHEKVSSGEALQFIESVIHDEGEDGVIEEINSIILDLK